MIRNMTLLFVSLLLLTITVDAQNPYVLLLKSGPRVPAENVEAFVSQPDWKEGEAIAGRFYRLLQFREIPTQEARQAIEASGVRLMSYFPHRTYLASIPAELDLELLKNWGVRSIDQFRPVEKLHSNVVTGPYPDWALEGEKVKVILRYPGDLDPEWVAAALASERMEVTERYDYGHMIWTTVDPAEVHQLAGQVFVEYLEMVPPPDEPENYMSRAMHRSNVLASEYSGGRRYDGTGVKVAIGDDGVVGPHIDFQGRILATNTTSNGSIDHSDHVAGTILGAGNLNPKHKGAAFGADLYVFANASPLINSYPGSYIVEGIRINSLSLSNGCNAGYTSLSSQVDQQVRTLPGLLYSFSAGNEGRTSCGGITGGWRTITGGHKAGKNVFAVANLEQDETRNTSSSQGPATDGRIKPDVAALGTDVISTMSTNSYQTLTGTSMACPGVSGLLAQLFQAHSELNGGVHPEAGLLKALLLNTADDIGNPGPDFSYGWGRVNGRRAVEALENRQYRDSIITQGGTNSHTLTIPANVGKAKIMIYWTDYEGAPNADPALVNNLDLLVTDPSGVTHSPWLLNAGPNPNTFSCAAAATRGVDTLNNMEQVEIDNPPAGTYTISVAGTAVPQGPQKYYLTYELLRDTIVVTYPIGGESFVPGETERIRWDALGTTGTFNVEFSPDNGGTWIPLTNVAGSRRYVDVTVPTGGITGSGRVRVTRAGKADISDAPFSVIGVPRNLRVVQVCQGYTRLEWDALPGATAYDVFMLGNKYMDSVGTTSMTTYDVTQANFNQENWFSVRAKVPAANAKGRRAIAISQPPGLLNCAAVPPQSVFQLPGSVCMGQSVTFQDQSRNGPASWQWVISPSTYTFVNGTNANSQNPSVIFTAFDTYTITLITTNFAGTDTSTQVIDVNVGLPTASFTPVPGGLGVIFVNNSVNGWFYTWDFGDGSLSTLQNPSHRYAQSGTYTVTLTVRNPCGTITTSQTFSIIGTQLEGLFEGAEISLFPNPSEGNVRFEMEGGPDGALHFTLFNLQGQAIRRFERRATNGVLRENFDFSDLGSGIYLLRVQQGEKSGSIKLMIR